MGDRLSALDATFLELEEADQGAHMHIGGVMVFEPPAGERAPSLDAVRRDFAERLHALPRFSQRLSTVHTGGLEWPTWIDDERFDVADHVRRARLPSPGGQSELLDWAGDFYSSRLDRTTPLWEAVLVEGLEDGRWAIATKTHHCMVDGIGSIDVGHVLLDSEPGSPAAGVVSTQPESPQRGRPGPRRPADPKRLSLGGIRAARTLALTPWGATRWALGLARRTAGAAVHPSRAREALHASRAMAELVVREEVIAAPRTSLNVPIGGKRRLVVASASLTELKDIRRALGGTINDVVLAVAAGALRRLLLARGETPPAGGLRAMVPVNVRHAGEQLALGNRITSLFVRLPVAEPDPLIRYATQMHEAEELKSGTQAMGATTLLDLTSVAPPVLHSFLARSLYATRLFNVTITNVPGPQMPLYSGNSRLVAIWPLVPLAAEHAVGLAVLSYDGSAFFAFNLDRDAVPDFEVLRAALRESLVELCSACERRPVRLSGAQVPLSVVTAERKPGIAPLGAGSGSP